MDSGQLDFAGDADLAEFVQSASDSIERTNSIGFGLAMVMEITHASSLPFLDVLLRLLWFTRDHCAHGVDFGVFFNAAAGDGVNHLDTVR